MLGSFDSDLVVYKMKFCESLCEKVKMEMREMKKERKKFTVLFRKASAKCWIPWLSIPLLLRMSLVSVFAKQIKMSMRKIKKEREIHHVIL